MPLADAPQLEPAPPRGLLARARGRISTAIGVTPETRFASARAMLERRGTDSVGYWLLLVLSMGIATYGLVLGSAAVVIGAMLVSPLMTPLVGIGMGLVVGSPSLAAHALLRTAASVAVVIGLAAALTLALPYHETTQEIVARTSPTLLDLYVACFCAVAATYTVVRGGSDIVAAASGTAVSIALVPPLCVVGWGLGSRDAQVWRGAMLLFTANFSAIVLFSALGFLLLAYDTVDVVALEQDAGRVPTRVDRVAARLRQLFGSKHGSALRLFMPLALTAAVFVPLRSALNEVAWSVSTRAAIQKLLDAQRLDKRTVRSVVSVSQHAVVIRLLVVGDAALAKRLKHDLETHVAAIARVTPLVEVVAVPDAEAIRLATQVPITPAVVEPSKADLALVRDELDSELRNKWPTAGAGELLTWRLVIRPSGGDLVEVVHFGKALGPAGEELLAHALGQRVGRELTVQDVAMTESPATAAPERGLEWIPALSLTVDQAVAARVAHVCITSASGAAKGPAREQTALVDAQIKHVLERLPPDRGSVRPGEQWSVALSPMPCPPEGAPSDAGRD